MGQLPLKSQASYYPDFLGSTEAEALFDELLAGFDITDKRINMSDGSEFIAENAYFIFADPELTSFDMLPEAWGNRAPWTVSLVSVRERIAALTGVRFHVARCVYYLDGSEGVDFHQDLPAYGDTSEIASLSLGAERDFVFRSVAVPEERFVLRLAHGSLLFMGEGCQDYYEHSLPHDENCLEPRLNITFRKYGFG